MSKEGMTQLFEDIFGFRESYFSVECFFRDHVSYFNDLPNWVSYLTNFSHGISARIHGGIAMVTAGVPTIIIGIDSRVVELSDTFKIPCISESEFMNSSISSLFAGNPIDGKLFDINRSLIASRFMLALEKCDLSPSDHLRRLANG
jgi:hypothetical protein